MRNKIFKMKEYAKEAVRQVAAAKRCMLAAVAAGMFAITAFPAYADGLMVTDSAIKTMLNSTIDIVFLIFSVGIAVMGAFQLIPAIIHFI